MSQNQYGQNFFNDALAVLIDETRTAYVQNYAGQYYGYRDKFNNAVLHASECFDFKFPPRYNRLLIKWDAKSTPVVERCIEIIAFLEQIRAGEHPEFSSVHEDKKPIVQHKTQFAMEQARKKFNPAEIDLMAHIEALIVDGRRLFIELGLQPSVGTQAPGLPQANREPQSQPQIQREAQRPGTVQTHQTAVVISLGQFRKDRTIRKLDF